MPECKRVTIVDITIPILTYREKKVITLSMMDSIHHRAEGTARKRFNDHKEKLVADKHFFHVTHNEMKSLSEFRTAGIAPNSNGIVVLTERGYSKLVKSFTDDLAWEVQDQLVDNYFEEQQQFSTAEFILQQAQIAVDQERKIKAIEIRQDVTDRHIVETNAKVRLAEEKADNAFKSAQAALEHKFGNADYFTIMAYCSINNQLINANEARISGLRARKVSKENNRPILKIPDERYGTINSYHVRGCCRFT